MSEYKRLINSHSTKETEQIARCFSTELKEGACIAFLGDLGAGKTAFVRGLAKGLDVSGEVCSPTFALVHEYSGKIPLVHFDMYRVTGEDDLYATGYYDYLDSGATLAIEWSENITQYLPKDTIFITITTLGEDERMIEIATQKENDE